MLQLEQSYTNLPKEFFEFVVPEPVSAPNVVCYNDLLAQQLGIDLDAKDIGRILSGNTLIPNCNPIAQAYAGHQFGHLTMLGDGRACLLGEFRTPTKELFDLQLKGSGLTPYSRRGDGRAALGPMLREYIMSEALAGLGIPTTRSLAVVSTGEPVYRSDVQPGAVLSRVASSHIRIGTFEYAAACGIEHVKQLSQYTMARHYRDLGIGDYLGFFDRVCQRQADLVAQWQAVGFIHGVMNTDNTAISGETIDFGPCAMLDEYRAATVFSSIDHRGRYSYSNQSKIILWNLARLAEVLIPLIHPENGLQLAEGVLQKYASYIEAAWLKRMTEKIGITAPRDSDAQLVSSLLAIMESNNMDFTNTFRDLSDENIPLTSSQDFSEWRDRWSKRLQDQDPVASRLLMQRSNPRYIARNHLVEEIVSAAEFDPSKFQALLSVLSTPFDQHENMDPRYRQPPQEHERVTATFCGT